MMREKGLIRIERHAVYEILLLLWPILNTYGFFVETIGIGDVLIIPYSLYLFFIVGYKKTRNIGSSAYFNFFIFSLFISAIGFTSTLVGSPYSIALSLLRKFTYIFCFAVVAPRKVSISDFLRRYKKICIFLSLLVILQVVLNYWIGYSRPFILNSSIFPVRDVNGYSSYILNWNYHIQYESFKAPSVFSEASKYAQYVVPCLLFSLIETKKRKGYKFEIFVSICLFLTKSANAAIFTLIAWCCWVLFSKENTKKVTKFIVTFLGIIGIVFLLIGDAWIITRLTEIGKGVNSGSMRVLRGWIILGQLPLFNRIFGVGMANVASYIELSGIKTGLDAGYIGYMSGLSEIGVATGILSLFAFAILLFKYIRCPKAISKSMAVLILVVISSSAILDTPTYGLMIVIIEYYCKPNRKVIRDK